MVTYIITHEVVGLSDINFLNAYSVISGISCGSICNNI